MIQDVVGPPDGALEAAQGFMAKEEVIVVARALVDAQREVLSRMPVLTAQSISSPPDPALVDGAILAALKKIASEGVMGGASKLAMVSGLTAQIACPEGSLEDPARAPTRWMFLMINRRVQETDFYLSEYRSLSEMRADEERLVVFQTLDGSRMVQKQRIFPMWEVERVNGLDTLVKARAWYKEQLIRRGIARG